ncbi:hypothetical protein EDB84DRAFT_1468724 [Lactarius hengduanensis]|nr:hypothetical protein EDB84DRAFT_1468724 [Lactarius hengduanensis]
MGFRQHPFIGGVLSRPQDHWPDRFSHPFGVEYPYFLPCLSRALRFRRWPVVGTRTVGQDSYIASTVSACIV